MSFEWWLSQIALWFRLLNYFQICPDKEKTEIIWITWVWSGFWKNRFFLRVKKRWFCFPSNLPALWQDVACFPRPQDRFAFLGRHKLFSTDCQNERLPWIASYMIFFGRVRQYPNQIKKKKNDCFVLGMLKRPRQILDVVGDRCGSGIGSTRPFFTVKYLQRLDLSIDQTIPDSLVIKDDNENSAI